VTDNDKLIAALDLISRAVYDDVIADRCCGCGCCCSDDHEEGRQWLREAKELLLVKPLSDIG
jgi:hypothetical protein